MEGVPLWKKIGGGARREIPCGVSIGIQDSVEQLLEKIERELAAGYQRIKMKIKPGWDVDVVRARARAFPADQADGRRQLGLHAGRRRTSAQAGRLLPDDDRAAAGPRRHHRPRRVAGAAADAHLPGRIASARAHHAAQAIRLRRLRNYQHQAGPRGRVRRSAHACTTWPRPRAFRCGAAACSKPASAARTTWRWPRCPISCCRATFRPAGATGSATSSSRPVETTPHGTIAIRDEPGFGYALDQRIHRAPSRCARRRSVERLRLAAAADNRNYRYTWVGQVVSEIGDHFNNIAVFSLAVAHTTLRAGGERGDALARHSGDADRARWRAWCSTGWTASRS